MKLLWKLPFIVSVSPSATIARILDTSEKHFLQHKAKAVDRWHAALDRRTNGRRYLQVGCERERETVGLVRSAVEPHE
jgi:hypothetical protein